MNGNSVRPVFRLSDLTVRENPAGYPIVMIWINGYSRGNFLAGRAGVGFLPDRIHCQQKHLFLNFFGFPFVVKVTGLSRKELRFPRVRFDRQEKSGRRISKASDLKDEKNFRSLKIQRINDFGLTHAHGV
jgi:hypothetical protein